MANWRQVQARIRKARTSAEPVAKLSELYQKTRDAMVAYELAQLEEKALHSDEAIRWFRMAQERFRREEWRKKCAEALLRLGAPATQHPTESFPEPQIVEAAVSVAAEVEQAHQATAAAEAASEAPTAAESPSVAPGETIHRKRRRGRRGGRKHRRGKESGTVAQPPKAVRVAAPVRSAEIPAIRVPSARVEFQEPKLPSERVAHGRASEPALASRMAKLESLLRRLLTGPLHRLDELEDAPASPGVFLLSDSDLTTSYYVESCQTLRVGLGNLVRGGKGRGSKDAPPLKARLAEHLEINENKVGDYLKKHCVVRWLQLDEDAQHLAHFAIAVLRTPLNSE